MTMWAVRTPRNWQRLMLGRAALHGFLWLVVVELWENILTAVSRGLMVMGRFHLPIQPNRFNGGERRCGEGKGEPGEQRSESI